MINSIKVPVRVNTISETLVETNEKAKNLEDLTTYVESYVREKIFNLNLKDNGPEKATFIEQCKIACKLAIKLIQEGKNHRGTTTFINLNYDKLFNIEAINLFNILTGNNDVIRFQGNQKQAISAASNLDKLCKHRNTILKDRKLSFWGTNYTSHAERFRQWINKLEDNVANLSKVEINNEVILDDKELNNFNAEFHTFNRNFNVKDTKFLGDTNFKGCHFKGKLKFESAEFKPKNILDFRHTIFEQELNLSRVNIYGMEYNKPTVSFRNAEFKDDVHFGHFGCGSKYAGNEIDLRGIKISEGKHIYFTHSFEGALLKCSTIYLDSSALKHMRGLYHACYPYRESAYKTTGIYIDDKPATREDLLEMLRLDGGS